jgi:plasmid maintenance system antidote protein VapI
MALAKKLGIQQQSVMGLARRNSSKLTLYDAIQLYKEYGFKEEDILLKSTK